MRMVVSSEARCLGILRAKMPSGMNVLWHFIHSGGLHRCLILKGGGDDKVGSNSEEMPVG